MKVDDGWEPVKKPYEYTAPRKQKDRKDFIKFLREFFMRSKMRRYGLRSAAYQKGREVRYRCADCKLLFKEVHVQVDHISPVACHHNFSTMADALTHRHNWQVLCITCHKIKTQDDLRKIKESRSIHDWQNNLDRKKKI